MDERTDRPDDLPEAGDEVAGGLAQVAPSESADETGSAKTDPLAWAPAVPRGERLGRASRRRSAAGPLQRAFWVLGSGAAALLLSVALVRWGAPLFWGTPQSPPAKGEPSPGQPSPGEPNPGQPTPGQPTPGQPTPGQTTPGQPTPGQPTPGGPDLTGLPTPPPAGAPALYFMYGKRSCKMVALTYDAGSGADGAAAILDMLKARGLHSTFFLTGRWAEQFPDLARRIKAEGHEIASHSYSHPDFTTLSEDAMRVELDKASAAIKAATGADPRPFFRAPYGAWDERVGRLLNAEGYPYTIHWDVDTLDWQFPGVAKEVERILKAQGGSIVLMHMNVADTAVASDQAIPVLQARDLQPVPLSELLRCQGS
ncbi:MAG TPA: polysaccharide deacetylase family protein [Symbiobacteriaceae bacterium]|nr:polysaccharide deacetylase family protein [Symbiobacteriaceae bacterium]